MNLRPLFPSRRRGVLARRQPRTVSELEYLVVLQQTRLWISRELLDLLHCQLDLARLEVRYIYLSIALELRELLSQQRRTQVPGELGEAAILVGERRFDDQIFQIFDTIHDPPKLVVRPGIPRKDQTAFSAIEQIAYGRNGMNRRQHGDLPLPQSDRRSHGDLLITQPWLFAGGNLGEIGPDIPVEQVFFQSLDRCARGVHRYRLRPQRTDGIHEKRDRIDMIEMRDRKSVV